MTSRANPTSRIVIFLDMPELYYIMLVMDEKTPTIYSDPDLLKQAEDLYFALSQNITIAGKNTIFHCIDDAKQYYHTSNLKQEWEGFLNNLTLAAMITENINIMSLQFAKANSKTIIEVDILG